MARKIFLKDGGLSTGSTPDGYTALGSDNGELILKIGSTDTPIVSIPTIFKQNIQSSLTGTTVKTIIYSALINNNIQLNDILKIQSHFSTLNNTNLKTVEMYLNTSPDLIGSPILIATRLLTSLSGSSFSRNLVFKNSLTSQGIVSPGVNIATDEAVTQPQTLISADFNVNQYIIVTFQLTNSADTVTMNNIIGTIVR